MADQKISHENLSLFKAESPVFMYSGKPFAYFQPSESIREYYFVFLHAPSITLSRRD